MEDTFEMIERRGLFANTDPIFVLVVGDDDDRLAERDSDTELDVRAAPAGQE